MRIVKKGLLLIAIVIFGMYVNDYVQKDAYAKSSGNERNVKNIILLISDGVSVPHVTMHRSMKGSDGTLGNKGTAFDPYFIGSSTMDKSDFQLVEVMQEAKKSKKEVIHLSMDEGKALQDKVISTLEEMKKKKKDFFLVIEDKSLQRVSGQHDIVSTMKEMDELEGTFNILVQFASIDKQTLIVATSPHVSDGFVAREDSSKVVGMVKQSPQAIAKEITSKDSIEQVLRQYIGFTLLPEEIESVKASFSKNEAEVAINDIINKHAGVTWITGKDVDEVPVYVYGVFNPTIAELNDTKPGKNMVSTLIKSVLENTP